MPLGPLILFSHSEAPTIAVSAAVKTNGSKTQRFKKELIRDGQWVKESDGLSFAITPQVREHWHDTFAKMKANGVRIPIPLGHDPSDDPDKNRGWMEDTINEGESLFGIIDIIDEDPETLAKKSDVSIYVPPRFTDGKGVEYVQPIRHVALTTNPVITGLAGFMPIAASGGATTQVPILQRKKEENPMKLDLKKIQAALGITEELTEANAEALILSAGASLTKKAADAEAAADADKQALILSQTKKKPEPLMVEMAADSRRTKLDFIAKAGNCCVATRDALSKLFIGDGKKTDALELALTNGTHSVFDGVIEALKLNTMVKLGEETGQQVIKLAHNTEEETGRADELKKLREQAADIAAGGKKKKSA